jgi:transposase
MTTTKNCAAKCICKYPGKTAHSLLEIFRHTDYVPLHRQSVIYGRQGVELSRSTLERWVDAMADKLRPLYDELNGYPIS